MSHAPTRVNPRWSVVGQEAGLPALSAALAASNACASVAPPLSARVALAGVIPGRIGSGYYCGPFRFLVRAGMSSIVVLWILRVLHIWSGVFWVGSVLFMARFIFPTVGALGPAAGPFMEHLTRVRKLPQAMMGAGVATILTGLLLYWRVSGGFEPAWMSSPTGIVFGLGGFFAISGFTIGVTVNLPASRRLAALGAAIHAKGGPPDPAQADEMRQLQRRMGIALRATTVLLALATVAMALARYVT
jgi:hypothetical protein